MSCATEPRELAGDLFAQPFAALTAPFCQTSEGQQRARRAADVAQCPPALEQPVRLDLGIVEVAQHALQFFRPPRMRRRSAAS